MHRCVIYVEVICCDIWISCRFLLRDFTPQTRRSQYICFIYGYNLFVTFASCFHSNVHNALYFVTAVCFFIPSKLISAFALCLFAFTEINTASQLTNDNEIYILNEFLFKGRILLQRWIDFYRTQVTEQTKLLAKTEDCFLRTDRRIYIIPFRTAYSTKQYSISSFTSLNSILSQRHTICINRRTARFFINPINLYTGFLKSHITHSLRCSNNLSTDTITRDQYDILFAHITSPIYSKPLFTVFRKVHKTTSCRNILNELWQLSALVLFVFSQVVHDTFR